MLYTVQQTITVNGQGHVTVLHLGRNESVARFILEREKKHYHVFGERITANETVWNLEVKPEFIQVRGA